ncbi:MAG: hypothetical protein QM765_01835 [Myxococcales bacterium]
MYLRELVAMAALLIVACSPSTPLNTRCTTKADCRSEEICYSLIGESWCQTPCTVDSDCAEWRVGRGCCSTVCSSPSDGGPAICGCVGCE